MTRPPRSLLPTPNLPQALLLLRFSHLHRVSSSLTRRGSPTMRSRRPTARRATTWLAQRPERRAKHPTARRTQRRATIATTIGSDLPVAVAYVTPCHFQRYPKEGSESLCPFLYGVGVWDFCAYHLGEPPCEVSWVSYFFFLLDHRL